jgi:hypothetical protein
MVVCNSIVLEAVGATSMYFNNLDSTRSTQDLLDNEISTMNDQVSMIFPYISIRMLEGNIKKNKEKSSKIFLYFESSRMRNKFLMVE